MWSLGAKLDAEKLVLEREIREASTVAAEASVVAAEASSRAVRKQQQLEALRLREKRMVAGELQAIEDQERFEREVVGGNGQEGVAPSGSSEGQVDVGADFQDFLTLPPVDTWLDSALEGVDFGGGTPQPSDDRFPDS